VSDRLVAFGLTVYASISLRVLMRLGIGTGNPGVFQGYPYPYPRKPVPVFKGTGFTG
jgi:hypothetical protein